MASLAGLPNPNAGKADARPLEDDLVADDDIEENYSDEDFERDDALSSSLLDSKPKPVRDAEGGSKTAASDSKQPLAQGVPDRPGSQGRAKAADPPQQSHAKASNASTANPLDADDRLAPQNADGQKLPEEGLF